MSAVPTQADKQARLASILACAPVMPVVTLDAADDAVPMACALAAGGIGAIEVTLRTAAGLDAIRAIATAGLPGVVVGAGTVLDARQVEAAHAAGAGYRPARRPTCSLPPNARVCRGCPASRPRARRWP